MGDDTLTKAMQAEGAAGDRFKDQHGGFYSDEQVLSMIFDPIKEYVERTRPIHRLKIADLGCGSGIVGLYVEERLNKMGYDPVIVFIDSNPKMLDAIKPASGRQMVLADLSDLSDYVDENEVDIAFGRHFIHYVEPEKQIQILKNIFSYIKEGGLFVNATGSHEDRVVSNFMADYLSNIISIRGTDVRRYYQSIDTYCEWMSEIGFTNPHVVGSYGQPHRTFDFHERYGYPETMTPEEAETKANRVLEIMGPNEKIRQALSIKEGDGHHSVDMIGKIFVAEKR